MIERLGVGVPARLTLKEEQEMKVKFSAEVEVPDGIPVDYVEAWLQFNLGATGGLPLSNPLSDTDLTSIGCRSVRVEAA